ncbi:hypothetical protein PsYK624_086510 [Phanerochaete sordida]|uniref:Uncharacterized protein n=1 Tax=Phanerochaete sordida TaxID=48140 RepID=A0A9P3GB27_9APHY|nr:hypothetical protein PsYK624_086510 [Phanerochaete sordida]
MSTKSGSSRSSSSSASSAIAPNSLVALPSLASSLSSLPMARSMDGIALHPSSMSAQRAAESEAKLKKVLSKSAASNHPPSAYMAPSPTTATAYSPDSPALTMRKPLKQKISV